MDTIVYALLKKKITSALTGIAKIYSDEDGKIVFITNDGETFSVNVPGGALPENFIVSNGVGKAEIGTEYKAGTALADIVIDMLSTYTPPTINIKTNLEKEIFDKVTETVSLLRVTGKITPGSKEIQKVTIFINNQPIAEYESDTLREDNEYVIDYTFDPATNTTFSIKVTVNDGENTSATKQIIFVGKSYWGYVGESVTEPTAEDVKNLQFNTVKNSRSLLYENISIKYGKVLYAYPTTLGALAKIVDEDGRNYSNSYNQTEIEIDGIPYYCYLLIDAMGTDNGYQKYS